MSILQDTYFDMTLIKNFAPQHIAIAIIYLLIQIYKLEIPEIKNENEHLQWMKIFSSSMTDEILVNILTRINTIYKHIDKTLDQQSSTNTS